MNITLIFMGGFGATELLLIMAIVFLFFGGKKIPEMMKGIGKGIREFKEASNEKGLENNSDEPK